MFLRFLLNLALNVSNMFLNNGWSKKNSPLSVKFYLEKTLHCINVQTEDNSNVLEPVM